MELPATRPQRISYLGFYRAFAIMAVVAIHATSTAVAHYPKQTLDHQFYFFWNSFLQFAVPAFLFLSSLVLFYNYSARTNEQGWKLKFYKKRLLYVFVPYLVWSLIYFVVKEWLAGEQPLAHWPRLAEQLLTGRAHTHLYFFLIILQFYIVFPWLLALTRYRLVKRYFPLFFVAGQAVFYALHLQFHFERLGSLLPSYLIVIGFGAWAGLNYEAALKTLRAWKIALLLALMAGGAVFIYGGGMIKSMFASDSFVAYALLFVFRNLFTLSACLLLLLVCAWIERRKRPAAERVTKVLNSLGTVSFGVFLIHPMVLLFWRRELAAPLLQHFSLGIAMSYAAALLLSWMFAVGLRKVKWGWVLIGQ